MKRLELEIKQAPPRDKMSVGELRQLADKASKDIPERIKKICEGHWSYLWKNHDQKSKNQMGKLLRERQSEF